MRKQSPKLPEFLLKRTEAINEEAETILTQTIPSKIRFLSELADDPRFDPVRLSEVHAESEFKLNNSTNELPTSKRKYSHSIDNRPCPFFNVCTVQIYIIKPVVELNNVLKPELRLLMNICLKLQVWIQLQIPKIEDGNNFGVSVQEALLEEVNRIQQDIGAYLEQFQRYHGGRAKMVSKMYKYPGAEDIIYTIREMDEKEFLTLRIICSELANYYHSLLDILLKNYQKVVCPRSDHHGSMF